MVGKIVHRGDELLAQRTRWRTLQIVFVIIGVLLLLVQAVAPSHIAAEVPNAWVSLAFATFWLSREIKITLLTGFNPMVLPTLVIVIVSIMLTLIAWLRWLQIF